MATPRGSQHRDMEQRLRDLESQVQTLTGVALRREQLKVSEGDFVVSGGGSVVVKDGGDLDVSGGGGVNITGGGGVEVDGEGHMLWRDPAGRERFRLGIQPGQVSGGQAVRLVYFGLDGTQRTVIGQILSSATGETVGHGLLVEDSNGKDMLSVKDSEVYVGGPHGNLVLHTANGTPDSFQLSTAASEPFLNVEIAGATANIWGGREGDGSLSTLLQLVGTANGSNREVRVRDGANSTYRPIAASEFAVRSSSAETKDVLGDPSPGALDTVRGVRMKRWRHKEGGRSARVDHEPGKPARVTPVGTADLAPERVGPMAEDVPPAMASDAEGSGINLSAALWTLWQAVQELSDQVQELRTQP